MGQVRPGGVLAIGFVEDDQNITGNLFEEDCEFAGAKGGARGIVGVGDINDSGLRGYGGGDGIEVERIIAHWRLDEMATAGANGNREKSEGALAGNAFKPGAQQSAGGEVDDFAGAETDEDFFETDVVAGCQDFAETLTATIGIPVGLAESATGGFHGLGGGAEGILVGSKLNGVNLEVLLDFFNGLARNVGREALDVIGNEFFEGVRHEFILCSRLANV